LLFWAVDETKSTPKNNQQISIGGAVVFRDNRGKRQFLLTKKLWVYNFWAVDDGHFTPLALPAFAFLGFYFWAIALIVQGLIK